MGYSIVTICEVNGPEQIIYRQWSKGQRFVAGVDFSNDDSGMVDLSRKMQPVPRDIGDKVLSILQRRLNDALASFVGQSTVWIPPKIKNKPENAWNESEIIETNVDAIITNPRCIFIHAPAQFGLTCLGNFLVKEAWSTKGHLWIYIDSKQVKSGTLQGYIKNELELFDLKHSDIKCFVIDSIESSRAESWKLIPRIGEKYENIPIVALHTIDPYSLSIQNLLPQNHKEKFESLFLWALPRNALRGFVTSLSNELPPQEKESILNRIVADLETLNLHRTPLNCLTLLKVSLIDFDENPINRAELINRVLFLIFNSSNIPSYRGKPDLKDCEFVLGYFCEYLIRNNIESFTKLDFINTIHKYCTEHLISLDTNYVLDVLLENRILIPFENQIIFKYGFWFLYFSAIRMNMDSDFSEYILKNGLYKKYPEIIEFYTGLDRRRTDALTRLMSDLKQSRQIVEKKCGFPKDLDPFSIAQWMPNDESVKRMEAEIEDAVKASALPAEIKDRYADQGYDPARPYTQSFSSFAEHSVTELMRTTSAVSKALRNSDYVHPDIKREALREILQAWEQLSIVLLVILPVLADQGHASFDGAHFVLDGDFGSTVTERSTQILMEIPGNIIRWSKDDLHSTKMAPLLIDVFKNERRPIQKHELALALILHRPKGWEGAIHSYVVETSKNSFYLLSVYRTLRAQYRFSQATSAELKEIEQLIRLTITKHMTGAKDPGVKLIKQTIPRLIGTSIVPDRAADTD